MSILLTTTSMPEIDLTITISVILGVSAIISPVLTTLLSNWHAYKMRKLDMKLEAEKTSYFYKRGVYEEYLKVSGRCIAHADADSMREYGEAYLLALTYFPEDLQIELMYINDAICSHDFDNALNLLNDLAPKIRAILQSM